MFFRKYAIPPDGSSGTRMETASLLVPLFVMTQLSCASQRSLGWVSDGNGQSSDGDSSQSDSGNSSDGNSSDSNSDGSSDSKSSDGQSSQSSEGEQSNSNSDNSSESRSETSGTVTTKGQEAEPAQTNNGAILIITGATLLGLAVVGAITLLDDDGPQAYLDKHGREVRLALARGQGPFVHDVGHNLGIAPKLVPHLGRVLQRARERLEPLMTDGKGFAAELVRVLLDDRTLQPPTQELMKMIQARG